MGKKTNQLLNLIKVNLNDEIRIIENVNHALKIIRLRPDFK